MRSPHYAQRQHIVQTLDALCFQLHTLSFFLSPSIWTFVSRLFCQTQCSKAGTVDGGPSLRYFYAAVLAFNFPSVWKHATEGSAEGKAIILDFIGMSYGPSKMQLLALDCFIIVLQLALTAIAYETALQKNSSETDYPEDILLPDTSTSSSTSFSLPTSASRLTSRPASPMSSAVPETTKGRRSDSETPLVVDLRLRTVIARLRNPPPPTRVAETDSFLPLPNTTPWPLPAGMRMLMRASAQMRREPPPLGGTPTMGGERVQTVPGGLDARDG